MLWYQHEENKVQIPIFAIEGSLFYFYVDYIHSLHILHQP